MRKTSDNPEFPWNDPRVCYISQYSSDGRIMQVGFTPEARGDAAKALHEGEISLYAVWPGKMRSDMFVVDDPAPMLRAFDVVTEEEVIEQEALDEPEPEPIVSVERCNAESSPMSKGRLCRFHRGHEGGHSWEPRLHAECPEPPPHPPHHLTVHNGLRVECGGS